jgi:2-succinyl-6-hydroxy-2,4-cyclohexadiene-1-carboxylate synthase
MIRVLALHGFTGAPESFAGLSTASRRLELLCPALCGHGPSPALDAHDFSGELARLAAWVRARSNEPLPVLGYSLGARVALGLCLTYPELFSRAVLIGVHPGIADDQERSERVRWEESLIRLLETQGLEAFLSEWERLPLFDSQARLSLEAREAQRRVRRSHDAAGLGHALRVLGTGQMPDYFPQLGRLSLPVSLIVGENDHKFRSLAERALTRLPRGKLTVLPGSGHNPLLETPASLVHVVEAFLSAGRFADSSTPS